MSFIATPFSSVQSSFAALAFSSASACVNGRCLTVKPDGGWKGCSFSLRGWYECTCIGKAWRIFSWVFSAIMASRACAIIVHAYATEFSSLASSFAM